MMIQFTTVPCGGHCDEADEWASGRTDVYPCDTCRYRCYLTGPVPGIDVFHLEKIVADKRARGAWCATPYPGHPHGCPNLKTECIQDRPDFLSIAQDYNWYAITERFNLKDHAAKMKVKYPDWSERQCRNPLYWQGGVRKRLREKCDAWGWDILLDVPEACGIDVFRTMEKVGVHLERKPDMVIKVMIVGFDL